MMRTYREQKGRKQKKRRKTAGFETVFFLCMLLACPMTASAAEASVTFGSEAYESKSGETFPVGVYLEGEEAIGDYEIELSYDHLRLAYVSGADEAEEENGILLLKGTGRREQLRYRLLFQAVSGGEASLKVNSAKISFRDGGRTEQFEITALGSAPIHLEGTDTVQEQEEEESGNEDEEEESGNEQEEEESGNEDGAENAAGSEENESGISTAENDFGTGTAGSGNLMGNGQQQEKNQENQKNASESKSSSDEGISENTARKGKNILFNVYFAVPAAVITAILLLEGGIWFFLKKYRGKQKQGAKKPKKKRKKQEKQKQQEKQAMYRGPKESLEWDLDEEVGMEISELSPDLEKEAQEPPKVKKQETGPAVPVIQVRDVTMVYKLYTNNPSGLKDYFIRLAKRQITYRKLYALYHVSFDVYRGEVVGIIGTNGSGKSTLLKIVSGALKPAEGKVVVDRRKVQLLTLGTGFDRELTARENVYLNGSIIGYSREFLDAHYNDIVEFAELSDFMDEPVKNFSSGMVSRLGFAIATAGDAAEILILDEVLSVGDEFFRKKSLKRVKEMIHGGSTVLMVSHGMGTILDNCSKVVWIEKGKLRMVGEPKAVCKAYQEMNAG